MSATSDRIQDDVRDAIADDARIPYPAEIAVEAYGGAVILRGTVGNFAEKRAATADARRTRGVDTVDDELRVRLMDRDQREDADIRGAALQRLIGSSSAPQPGSPRPPQPERSTTAATTASVGWAPRGNGHAASALRDRSQTWVPPDLDPGIRHPMPAPWELSVTRRLHKQALSYSPIAHLSVGVQ
jgi:hypothetical protein